MFQVFVEYDGCPDEKDEEDVDFIVNYWNRFNKRETPQ